MEERDNKLEKAGNFVSSIIDKIVNLIIFIVILSLVFVTVWFWYEGNKEKLKNEILQKEVDGLKNQLNQGISKDTEAKKEEIKENVDKKTGNEKEIEKDEIKEGVKQNVVTKNQTMAYSIIKNGKNQLVLNKNGKEIILEEGDGIYKEEIDNALKVVSFSNLVISNDENYLAYRRSFYEGSIVNVYDIQKQLKIDTQKMGMYFDSGFGFSDNSKNFYFCNDSGYHYEKKNGIIYSLPDFKIKYSLLDDFKDKSFLKESFLEMGCFYDKNKNSVIFKLENNSCSGTEKCYNSAEKEIKFEYNLNSGMVIYN